MPRAQVAGAASEGYALHAERAGHGALQLRRLWLSEGAAARGAGGGEAHGLAHGLAHAAPARASAIHKQRRRSTGGGGRARLTDSVGAIFGATLKSVLDFSGVRAAKSEVVAALRHVARFFEPTRWDAAAVGGTDRDHLLNGLMAHRVDRLQRRHLPESREPVGARTYLGRNGLKDVAVGVTAAVLVAHYLMSARGARAADVCAGMRIALERASALLEDWPLSDGHADAWHAGALRAEERALQRARSAAVAAAAAAQAQGLPNHAALALQFEWMRAAAWPRGVCCDATTHAARCASLGQHGALEPDPAFSAAAAGGAPPPPPLTVPLAALPSAAWLGSAADAGSSSSEGSACDASSLASTASTASSASSASSVGSCEGVGPTDDALAAARALAAAEARRAADEACRLLARMT